MAGGGGEAVLADVSVEFTCRLAECTALLFADYALMGRGEASGARNGAECGFFLGFPGSRFDGKGG